MKHFLLVLFSILLCVFAVAYCYEIKKIIDAFIDQFINGCQNNYVTGGGCYEEKKFSINYVVDILNLYNCLENYIHSYNKTCDRMKRLSTKPDEIYILLLKSIIKSTTGNIDLVAKHDGNHLETILKYFLKDASDPDKKRIKYHLVSYTDESLKKLIQAREKYQGLLGQYGHKDHKNVKNDFYIQHGLGEIDDNYILYLSSILDPQSKDPQSKDPQSKKPISTKILSNDGFKEMSIVPGTYSGVPLTGNYLPDDYNYDIFSFDGSPVQQYKMIVKDFSKQVIQRSKEIPYHIRVNFKYDNDELCLQHNVINDELKQITIDKGTDSAPQVNARIEELKTAYLLLHIYLNTPPRPSPSDLEYLTNINGLLLRLRIRNPDQLTSLLEKYENIQNVQEELNENIQKRKGTSSLPQTAVLKEKLLNSIKWLTTYKNVETFDKMNYIDKITFPPPIKKKI